LFNWLFARRHGGSFILRLDDTDRTRSKPEYETAIERDLSWLGLAWTLKERQSERLARYDAARQKLVAAGRLYPCYETPEELEFRRKRLLAQGRPPVYDRAALKLDAAGRARFEAEGRTPHWRFKLASEEVRWDDLVRGAQHVDEASQSDPVLVRGRGWMAKRLEQDMLRTRVCTARTLRIKRRHVDRLSPAMFRGLTPVPGRSAFVYVCNRE
jgi:glutamyl-tRNA synthetase